MRSGYAASASSIAASNSPSGTNTETVSRRRAAAVEHGFGFHAKAERQSGSPHRKAYLRRGWIVRHPRRPPKRAEREAC